jgi:exopolyphosphatase/guanosine-5'-triphosphate,3'-diphosphate pyrophosphatase
VRIAALDLGSNSFHLLVVETRPDGSFVPLVREKEMLRLGDVVARDGRLTEEAIESAIETVRRFKAISEVERVDEIVAMGTAALREASNGAEAAERMEQATGVAIKVVSGIREAQLIFEAVRASVIIDPGPALCADLGGGSLELSVGDRFGLSYATSLHLGVGRLTTELVRSDPPTSKDRSRLRRRVSEMLDIVLADVLAGGPKVLIGTAGTFSALARGAVALRDGTVPSSLNQMTVTAKELGDLGDLIYELPSFERARLAGIDAKRAELLPAGVAVTEVLMERTDLHELTVCEWALREGIVISTIGKHDRAELGDDPRAIRHASVVSLCRRSRWREAHSRQVARLAVDVFDATAVLHDLGPTDRELLECAALLHDIGEHVSRDGHARHSAYLIENGGLRGFSPVEIQMLSCLGRYHVRGRPRDSFAAWESLERSDRDRVLKLLSILRIADGLDAAHGSVIGHVGVELGGFGVEIVVTARGEAELERWLLQRKKTLFEELFEVPVSLEVVPSGPDELQGLPTGGAGLG